MLTGDNTTRHITEVITQQPGTTCAGCHANLINPIGFALEGFDAIGRARTMEPIFQATGAKDPMTGQPIYAVKTTLPIDTTSVPALMTDDDRIATGAADLTHLMVDTGRTPACFARNYFRFTFKRPEKPTADRCSLDRVTDTVTNNGSLREGLRAIAESAQFKQRSFN